MADNEESHIYPVKQYVGARYVPIFGRKNETTVNWDNSKPYEPLTIVLYQGNSYTSKQYVPEGVKITDEKYWALTGNYNAQVEQYRREVSSKLDTVTHDDTLKGSGTQTDPIKVNLNHATSMRDTGNTVYPTLIHAQDNENQINGIGFNAGDGLTAFNTDDTDTGSGIKLNANIQASIENSEQCLTSLNAETPEKAKQLTDNITALQSTHVLVIGDSYGAGEGSTNPKTLGMAAQLCARQGWTLHNYAMGGRGYKAGASGNTNYLGQLNKAINEGVKADIIIVIGIQNDREEYNNIAEYTTTYVRPFFNRIAEKFPLAKVYLFNAMCSTLTPDRTMKINTLSHAVYYITKAYNNISAYNTLTSLINFRNIWATDNVHPTDIGHRYYAEVLYQFINNSATASYYPQNITNNIAFTKPTTDNEITFSASSGNVTFMPNGIANINITLNPTQAITTDNISKVNLNVGYSALTPRQTQNYHLVTIVNQNKPSNIPDIPTLSIAPYTENDENGHGKFIIQNPKGLIGMSSATPFIVNQTVPMTLLGI